MTTLHTVGHGTLSGEALVALLAGARVGAVVDVRSFPGSRRNPHFAREAMERWVPAAGIRYSWMRELGGRRRLASGSRHVALRHDAFQAYADHMETDEFLAGVDKLLSRVEDGSTAVMCSESVWWRCHRRLLADHLVLVRGVDVVHLMHDGRLVPHAVTDGARLVDRTVVYDAEGTATLPGDW